MRRLFFALLTAGMANCSFAASFCEGYQEGFKQASCHGKAIGCIPPIPPICPIPNIGESTWQHGYNRAFAELLGSRPAPQRASVGPMEGMKYVMDAGDAGRREREARERAQAQARASQAATDDLNQPATLARPDGTGAGIIRACRSLLGQTPEVRNTADTYVDAMQIQHCRSFIAGFHYARLMGGSEGERASRYCIPPNTPDEQIYAAIAYAPVERSPGVESAPEGVLVAGALAARFPCPANQ